MCSRTESVTFRRHGERHAFLQAWLLQKMDLQERMLQLQQLMLDIERRLDGLEQRLSPRGVCAGPDVEHQVLQLEVYA